MKRISVLIILTLLAQIVLPQSAAACLPDITVTPTFIDFGAVPINTTSLPETVTVTNDGTANLTIYFIDIVGTDDYQFPFAGFDIGSGILLPGASISGTIVFSPTSIGYKTAHLRVLSDDPYEHCAYVYLSGTGTEIPPDQPDISVSPLSIDFGTVLIDSFSATENVTVANTGTANLTIGNLTINNGQFTIFTGNISTEILIPGDSANITLVFKPTASGLQSANLTIPSDDLDENPLDVPLSGNGIISPPPPPTPTPTPPVPESTTAAPLYFTVDFLGKITKELADSDGRPVKRMEAPSPDGIHLLEIEAGTGASVNPNKIVTLIKIREARAPELPENTRLVGKAYGFEPSGTVFDKPIKLTLGYNVNELPDQVISIGAAYYTTKDGWTYLEAETTGVAELGKLTAPVNHFTVFAVLAKVPVTSEIKPPTEPTPEPEPAIEPALFNLSNLSITPSVSRFFEKVSYIVRTGEEALITVDVTNNGGQTGSYAAILILNGTERERKEITLEPGQTGTVSFTVTGNEPDSYTVLIGDLKGDFLSDLWINWWLFAGSIGVIILIIWLVWYIIKRKRQRQILI